MMWIWSLSVLISETKHEKFSSKMRFVSFQEPFPEGSHYDWMLVFCNNNQMIFKVVATVPIRSITHSLSYPLFLTTKCFYGIIISLKSVICKEMREPMTKIVSSYCTKVVGEEKIFRNTVCIYRAALSFLMKVANDEWDCGLSEVFQKSAKKAQRSVELLIRAISEW